MDLIVVDADVHETSPLLRFITFRTTTSRNQYMTQTSLKDVIEGAAAKYLSRVDADLRVSNGHEIGGLPSAGFKSYLGTPGKGDGEENHFSAIWTYLQDDEEE